MYIPNDKKLKIKFNIRSQENLKIPFLFFLTFISLIIAG